MKTSHKWFLLNSGGDRLRFAKGLFYSYFQVYSQEDEATSLLDVKENYNATNSGGVFVPGTFFKSNAIDQYIDTGFNPNADSKFLLDDCFFGFYIHTNDHPASGTPVIFDNGNCSIRLNGSQIEYKVNSGTYSSYTYAIPNGALIIAYRTASGTQKLNINGVDVASGSINSTSKPNGTFKLGQSYAGRWICSFAGKASDADFAQLYSDLTAYITSLSIYYPFRFWAAFEQTDATPITSPLPVYSKDSMVVTQDASNLQIIDNVLLKESSGTPAGNFTIGRGIPRKKGKCIAFRVKKIGTNGTFQLGFYSASTGNNPVHRIAVSASKFLMFDRYSAYDINFSSVDDTYYHCFIVLRDNGAYWFLQSGENYYLMLVTSAYNLSPVYEYAALGGGSSSPKTHLDWIRETQLYGDFLNDWITTTDSISDAVDTDTFIHNTSGWIIFYLATKTTSVDIEIRFRIQDASNYLKLTFDSSNNGKLWKTVAGFDTQLGSTATLTQGVEYKIFLNGADIRVFNSLSSPLAISATESSFSGETNGQVVSQGTGGNITYLKTLPFATTDNGILSQFEEITSVSDPVDGIVEEDLYIGP